MQKELNLENMEHNALEALGELQGTLDRIRFRQGLPPLRGRADKRMAYDTRRHPLLECGLEVSFEEALHHLNWSWNERHLTYAEIRDASTPMATIGWPKLHLTPGDWISHIPYSDWKPDFPRAYMRYKYKWQDKRLRPADVEDKNLARIVARAVSMHPLFSLPENVREKFPFSFYPDFTTRKNYCRTKCDGWRDLRWTLGDALRESAYWREWGEAEALGEELELMDANTFCLRLSILGQRLSMKHIRMLVEFGKFGLLEDVFKKIPRSWKLISPRELLLWVCANGWFDDEGSVRLVNMLEAKEPGIVAHTVDVFGDTPLWYTLYRYQYGGHVHSSSWQERAARLEKLLCRFECDPYAINVLGVSWTQVDSELGMLG